MPYDIFLYLFKYFSQLFFGEASKYGSYFSFNFFYYFKKNVFKDKKYQEFVSILQAQFDSNSTKDNLFDIDNVFSLIM